MPGAKGDFMKNEQNEFQGQAAFTLHGFTKPCTLVSRAAKSAMAALNQ